MARIPDEELRRLKREVDLPRLVRRRGVVLKPHGDDLLGLCPFHDDKEPSLVVSPRQEPLALPGRLRRGRLGRRLGHEVRGRLLPPRRRAPPGGVRAGAARGGAAAEDLHGPQAPAAGRPRRRGFRAPRPGRGLLPRGPPGDAGGARVPGVPGPPGRGADRALPPGLRGPDAWAAPAGQEPESRCRNPRAPRAPGGLPPERPRALRRLAGDPGLRQGGPGRRALRQEDQLQAAQGHAGPPLPARPAPRRLQPGGPPGLGGSDPL